MFSVIIFNLLVHILQSAEITVGPTSRNTTLNTSIKFTCQGIGDVIAFFVDGKLAASFNQGFQLLSESTVNGTVTRSLMATAYEENNNTNITCVILPSSPIVTSPPAVLMIQGILDGVGDLMATVLDGSNVSLTWTPPYSLDNVPITGYNIITSDGINITVNTPYHILTSSDPDPCNTTVSVGAINDVGTSQYNNVSFYYQTVPNESNIFGFAGLSQDALLIIIDISKLCVGERPNSITINVIYSNDIVNTTDISSIPMDQLTINHTVTLHDDWIEYFIVNVTLSNTAGEVSYSFPLGHVGPVNNIRSSSTDCSIINISWSRPSVHDRVNIHNYTLLIYRDAELIHTHTVNGNTTSYQFLDDDLFNHEYTYVIYGSNELGEGDYSNGTFSYLKVPESVRNDATLTLLDDNNTLHFNIPIILKCSNVLPVTINVSIHCDNTVLYSDGHAIDTVNQAVALSDNITILPSQYESCLLFITLKSTNGISDSYSISIDIPQVIPTSTTSIAPSSPTTSWSSSTSSTPTVTSNLLLTPVIATISGVIPCIIVVLVIVVICTIFCYYSRKSAKGSDDVEEPPVVIGGLNTAQPMLINVINYQHQPEMEHASARSESESAEVSQQLLFKKESSTAPNDRSAIYDIDENPTRSLPNQTNNGKHSKPKKKNAKKRKKSRTEELRELTEYSSSSLTESEVPQIDETAIPAASNLPTAPSLDQYISPGNNPVSDEYKSASVNDEQNESALSLSPGPEEIQDNMTKVTEQQ